ncbi:MAG: hypothetical protein OHK0053_20160 [Microscillaceae bacterium]
MVCLVLTFCSFGCGSKGGGETNQLKKGSPEHIQAVTLAIDDARLLKAEASPGDWLSYGLNYSENRFSPLKAVNTENVKDLGLAWQYELKSVRGVEATPIVVDGIMYTTGPWSVVYALDIRTGKLIWEYDPKVPREYAEKGCCDVVNRGVAIYKGKVYVGVFDGRLVALDASNGKVVWEKLTIDRKWPYTITGAPRVVKGKVIIGNGGGEYGVRGYLTAYDAETGEQAWRFYTVPGDPSQPQEGKHLEKAVKTWSGEWWKAGGGGTCWDAMAYDPELNLFYVGTGNGSPWNRRHRSPEGGDNLYLSSIVALNPDNGEMQWFFQTTPGDTWDFTATQHLILADLEIEGKKRKVIMQAPKNGFFYVIDRTNGEFISGKNYVEVNWAKGLDPKTGKPQEVAGADYAKEAFMMTPGPMGGHNWHPMSFNPQTGLVYIPAMGIKAIYGPDPEWQYNNVNAGIGVGIGTGWNLGAFGQVLTNPVPTGHLLAWDPVKQKEAWSVPLNGTWNGGTLTTAGNLVFQGTADGRFIAYDARNGQKLWESPTGTGVIAAPVTYEVDGEQYVTIMAGWGGAMGMYVRYTPGEGGGRILTFKIGAKGKLPEIAALPKKELIAGVAAEMSPENIQTGGMLYAKNCIVCHGNVGDIGGVIPNLAWSSKNVYENMHQYVIEGALAKKGMPNFKGRLTREEVEKIKAYLIYSVEEMKKKPPVALK